MAAIVAVAGAFLRYALDDERLSRRFLIAGGAMMALAFAAGIAVWPRQVAQNPQIHFHYSVDRAALSQLSASVDGRRHLPPSQETGMAELES